jgi:hypothetical protein
MSRIYASLTKGGREIALQLKGRFSESATLAKTCATWLAFLLTQRKEQREKLSAKSKERETRARIFQGQTSMGAFNASTQDSASLSI